MCTNDNLNQKVTLLTTVNARLTLPAQTDALTIVNTGRHSYLYLFTLCHIAASIAVLALLLDNLSRTAAIRTRLHIPDCTKQGLLCKYNLALSSALVTRLCGGTRLCTTTATGTALFLQIELKLLFRTEHGLFKANTDSGSYIRTLLRTVAGSSGTTSENIAENISENIPHVHAGKIKSTTGSATTLLKCGMTKLVVLSTLFCIT